MATSFRNDFITRASFSAGHPSVASKRVDQLERNARAAQILVGISAVAPIRIQHRERGREFGVRQMMIGDDDIDAALVCFAHYFGSTNAGVHADDQGDAHGRGALDDVGAHAVTVLQTMRNVKAGFAARHLDGFLQNDHRYCSVHVVVAVNQNLLFRLDGGIDARDGIAHAGQQERIVQMAEVGG